MAALTRSARALCLDCALSGDLHRATGDQRWAARAALLTPVAKAFATDVGCEVAELAVQVHGGMGYIEETGVAQLYRDVRVTTIYEGTNGIQAADLVGRKMADGGAALRALFGEIERTAEDNPELGGPVIAAAGWLRETTDWMLAASMPDRLAGSSPYLRALALVLGGHYLVRAAGADPVRVALARFHVEQVMPAADWLCAASRRGAGALDALEPVA
jgi:acyl-CoA dehydrogenase